MDNPDTSCGSSPVPDHTNCPIATARRRLQELHYFWHQTEDSYHDPVAFRTNLNAGIQAARNVTFALQSEKAAIPGFDEWYEEWRSRLKRDPVMKWLHGARNLVVKKGDLEVHSTARVSIKNWLEFGLGTLEVPPFLRADRLVAYLGKRKEFRLPPSLEESVLCVERRWTVEDLPQFELLEALSHGFEELQSLLNDAHARAEPACDRDQVESTRRPACMAASNARRTAYLRTRDHAVLASTLESEPLSAKLAKKGMRRYKLKPGSAPPVLNADDLFKRAEWVVETGKRMLLKDGSHTTIAFLILPDGQESIVSCDVPDQESKYVVHRAIASEVERLDATAVIFVGEIWWIYNSEFVGQRAGLSPSRREALFVIAAAADGRFRSYTTPFSRGAFGKIKLGQTEVEHTAEAAFLGPIREVWAKARDKRKA